MQKKFLVLVFVFAFVLTACGKVKDNEVNTNNVNGATLGEALDEAKPEIDEEGEKPNAEAEAFHWIAADEVAKHNTAQDCWTIIHDQVFDITKAIGSHPGGETIIAGCGKNATEMFESKPVTGKPHSQMAQENLDNFYLGDLAR